MVLSEKLSLDKYYANDGDDNIAEKKSKTTSSSSYSIQSIVHHIGNTANSGHYTADAKRMISEGNDCGKYKWISFDDGIATEITTNAGVGVESTTSSYADDVVTSNIQKQKTAYMVLYTLD